MSPLLVLPILLSIQSQAHGYKRPLKLKMSENYLLTLQPGNSEVSPLKVTLADHQTGKAKVTEFKFPMTFANPNRAIIAKLSKSDLWLVVGTEDTSRNALSFCLAVDPSTGSANLIVSDESGVVENRRLLRWGIICEENIAKWIFPNKVNMPDSDQVWRRNGVIDTRRFRISFTPWKPKKCPK